MLEQIDIKRQQDRLKMKYINSIETALFGEFNNGQLENFPKVRLGRSHWIPFICFQPDIGKEQMQQAALLQGEKNPIDECAAFMMEILNINDVTNVNLTLESLSQIHYDKLRFG